ncbi:MAG: hypothetical protein ACO3A2_11390 [Bdellovibrionia bacterium]
MNMTTNRVKKVLKPLGILPALWTLLTLSGCNLYESMDSPTGEKQLLSAARACFNLGDFTCALKYYQALTSSSSTSTATSDQAYSEVAFQTLEELGITISVFMGAVLEGNGSAGSLINQLAGHLRTTSSTNPLPSGNYAIRKKIFQAYQKSLRIQASKTQGLIKFMTASSLMAAILAEDASGVNDEKNRGKLLRTDLVQDPDVCLNTPTPLTETTACGAPAGKTITTGGVTSINLTQADESWLNGAPSLQMLLAATNEIQAGVSALSVSGGLGSSGNSLADSIISNVNSHAIDTAPHMFRYTLLSLGIGELP